MTTTGAVPPDWSHMCQTISPSPQGGVTGCLALDAIQNGLRCLGDLVVHPRAMSFVCGRRRDYRRHGHATNRRVGGECANVGVMSASQKPMTLEAFLDWEERQPLKYEFDGVHVRAMTGGTVNHGRVQRNLLTALANRLRKGPCEPFGSDMKVITARGARYPDASVICTRLPGTETSTRNAVIVFEIISPSTSGIDRFEKNQEYRDTPSIQRYVILEQDRLAATVFNREDGDWAGHLVTGETELPLPEIDISIPLSELYEGVERVIDQPPPQE